VLLKENVTASAVTLTIIDADAPPAIRLFAVRDQTWNRSLPSDESREPSLWRGYESREPSLWRGYEYREPSLWRGNEYRESSLSEAWL
jgi:hypothetical protein